MNGSSQAVKVSSITSLSPAFTVLRTVYKDRWFRISCVHVANVTAVPDTVQICLVPPAQSPGSANGLVWNFTIPANDFIEFGEGIWCPPNATVQALCATPAAINVQLSGVES